MRITSLAELLLQRFDFNPEQGRLSLVRTAGPFPRQIYQIIREAIQSHLLPAGMRLPSTRALAVEIGMSRNTVAFAYEQLLEEGLLVTKPSAGTFVADRAPNPIFEIDDQRAAGRNGIVQAALSSRGGQLIARAGVSNQPWGAFMPGVPDVTLFPNRIWARLQSKHWRSASAALLTYGQGGGYMPLRNAIADYVRVVRAVKCRGEQIIVTTGIHQSIDLITRLLGEPGDRTWVEDPCCRGTRNVLASLGMAVVPIPVDSEGM
jgi:GntR family transcriptional regulator/MocR family aminotransferase